MPGPYTSKLSWGPPKPAKGVLPGIMGAHACSYAQTVHTCTQTCMHMLVEHV